MTYLSGRINKSIVFILKILMFILLIVSIGTIYKLYNGLNFESILTLSIYLLTTFTLVNIVRNNSINIRKLHICNVY